MKVLVACEESQTVCKAFREKGHEAYSCDLVPCSGGRPEWHIQTDARELLKLHWDLIVAHPPCTYLTSAGAVRLFNPDHSIKEREREREPAGRPELSFWLFSRPTVRGSLWRTLLRSSILNSRITPKSSSRISSGIRGKNAPVSGSRDFLCWYRLKS